MTVKSGLLNSPRRRWFDLDVIAIVLLAAVGILACRDESVEVKRGEDADPVVGEVVTRFGEPLPASASLREVLQHPDAFERAQRVAQILQRSGPDQLDSIRTEFEQAALDRGDIEYALFGDWWARFDPEAAFVYCTLNLRTESPRVLLAVVRQWGRKDPLGAVASPLLHTSDLTRPGLAMELVDSLLVGWFESGRPGLEEWIQELNPNDAAAALKTYARLRVIRDGDRETLEWARRAPFSEDDRRLLIAGALSVIAHQNPRLAVEWIPIAEEDGVDIRTFVPRIASAWGHHDPRAALEWVKSYADDLERKRAVNHIARRWLKRDEREMARWIESHPGEAWLDGLRHQAVQHHVRHNRGEVDWPRMIERSEAVVDLNRRNILLGWVLRRWFVVDAAAAEAWVDAHPDVLPSSLIERIRTITPKARSRIEAELAGDDSST